MSIATLEVTGLKIGIAVAVLAGACGMTWFAADAHYSQALSDLQGQLKGAEQVRKDALADQAKKDADFAKGIDDEAKQQIGSMASVIADLSTRSAAISLQRPRGQSNGAALPGRVASSVPRDCPAVSDVQPERRSAAASDTAIPAPEKPTSDAATACLDRAVLDGTLDVGIDAMKAELLFRQFERGTGQAKP